MSRRVRASLILLAVVLVVGAALGLGAANTRTPASPAPTVATSDGGTATASGVPTASGSAPSSTPSATSSGTSTEPSVTWTRLSPAGVAPTARRDATWTVDPSSEIAYLYGGTTGLGGQRGGDALGDLWAYDLAADTWEPVVGTSDEPGPRFGHVAAWVEDVGLVVIGGHDGQGHALNDAWTFDPGSGVWTRLRITGTAAPGRFDACGAAPGDGTVWLSHGSTIDGLLADTWRLELGTKRWTKVTTGSAPGRRSRATCWIDAAGRFVLSGGATSAGPAADTWATSVGSADGRWRRLSASGPFGARAGAAVAVHLDQAVVVGGGGGSGLPVTGTMGATDTAISPLPADREPTPPRSDASLVDDPAGERMLLFGGASNDAVLDDLWSAELR